MLALSRKVGESILLRLDDGREITLHVVRMERNTKVRVAIDAPDDVEIIRSEIASRWQNRKVRPAS